MFEKLGIVMPTVSCTS